ncbi:hypothetical protein PMN64_40320 [Bradyrhizobium sp. UFLA01-814]
MTGARRVAQAVNNRRKGLASDDFIFDVSARVSSNVRQAAMIEVQPRCC